MDIHKPHAAHSWREFLIEIGTIICGILIALGLEQGVEAVHRDTEVREAREALLKEISDNAARFDLAMQENHCILDQVAAYTAWGKGGAKPPPFRYYMPLVRTNTWETVKTGAVTHMPLEERVAFSAFYDQVENQIKNNTLQTGFHWSLMAYADVQTLGADERLHLLKIAAQERQATERIRGITEYAIEQAKAMRLPGPSSAPLARAHAGVAWVCSGKAPNPLAAKS